MNICIYGTVEDRNLLSDSISCIPGYAFRKVSFEHFDNYDIYVEALRKGCYDAIFVTIDNAEGMEGVIAAKSICSDKPIVWFSNDRGFGTQSYRLGCTYFAEKSFTSEKLTAALSCCCKFK